METYLSRFLHATPLLATTLRTTTTSTTTGKAAIYIIKMNRAITNLILVLAGACAPGISWNTTGITVAGVTGAQGSNSTLITYPNDVSIDIYGNIYVADTNNQRIQRFPNSSSIGQTVAGATGTIGAGSNQFNYPRAIFVSGDVLYVSDVYNYRIQRYSYNAASATTVAGGKNTMLVECQR